MINPLRRFGLRFSTALSAWAAALAPLGVLLVLDTPHRRWATAVIALTVAVALVTFRGRRLTGWLAAAAAWLVRRRRPLTAPSEPVVGATVMPREHVAVRWHGDSLVALIALLPHPFTPTVVVDGRAHTDDTLDTARLQRLLAHHCPDLTADVVSAGYRVASQVAADTAHFYRTAIGADPAPAHRRTWIVVAADPARARRSSARRQDGVPGLIRYLVASTTRLAELLAGDGIDARCERSFDDYDRATAVTFVAERWSTIRGSDSVTAAYTATGGPDSWWAADADRTVTHVRVGADASPHATVLLTTATKTRKPSGFTRLSGAQRHALSGQTVSRDRHWQLPIGSAGFMIGETAKGYPVYLPFDDVDAAVSFGDAETFTRFVARAAAAGGAVTLTTDGGGMAEQIGARLGPEPKVAWAQATTFLDARPGVAQVRMRERVVSTPRHQRLPVRAVALPGEGRYDAGPDRRHRPADRHRPVGRTS